MRLDERGKQCPIPVIEAKKALEKCRSGEVVEVVVDNGIAVQNLQKMANHKGFDSSYEKVNDREFIVAIEVTDAAKGADGEASSAAGKEAQPANGAVSSAAPGTDAAAAGTAQGADASGEETVCQPDMIRRGTVVVLASNEMGSGDEALGKLLMKGFVYALTQQDELPETVIMFNSGAFLSCAGSENLEDLKELEAEGVEILTCGTCLNHYGLSEKLSVGSVTNMYEITAKLTQAKRIIRP